MSTAENLLNAKALAEIRQSRYASRKLTNQVALVLSLIAMSFGLFWLFWILFETIRLGLTGTTWATLTQMTPAPNWHHGGYLFGGVQHQRLVGEYDPICQ